MSELLPCPCGKVPTKLNIQDGDTYRWRVISADDSTISLFINGFNASACRKLGKRSTVIDTPRPAFGDLDLPGDCCGDWSIESSRIDISATPKQIEQQCTEDWNEASRSSETARLREQLKVAVGALHGAKQFFDSDGDVSVGSERSISLAINQALAQIKDLEK